MKYKMLLIIKIIAIIVLIYSMLTLFKDETVMYVNEKNQAIVNECLIREGESTIGVEKIAIGRNLGKAYMYVYYSSGQTTSIYVRFECSREASNLYDYVNDNGYNINPKAIIMASISIIVIVITIIYKKKTVK